MQLSWSRWRRRAPIVSLVATASVLAIVLVGWLSGAISATTAPVLLAIGSGFFVLLCWESFRLTRLSETLQVKNGEASQAADSEASKQVAQEELIEFLEHREQEIHRRQADLNEKALQLQQQLQLAETQDIFGIESQPSLSHFDFSPSKLGRKKIEGLQQTDRALLQLIERKTEELFGYIKENRYKSSGTEQSGLRTDLMREDAIELATSVARIYRPDDPDPLLHTNADSILRAISRTALQVLVTIENLPIPGGVHQLSFASIYPQVKRAVDSYSLYKDAKPYLDHASTALFVGRLALGANPLTLAAWWGISRAATYGAKQLGEHYINQQLLGVIRQAVEGIAIEVASLYSPQLRFRDANWIYGVELVELVKQLRMDPQACLSAMKELATLKMPDEFGRMLLMRWLATETSPNPEQYQASELLDVEARQLIAERLEKFLSEEKISRTNLEQKVLNSWLDGVSGRLGIQLKVANQESDIDPHEALETALLSLGSFAVESLGAEPAELIEHLGKTKTLEGYLSGRAETTGELEGSQATEFLKDCNFEFHPPEVLLPEDVSQNYFKDLIELSVRQKISEIMTHHESASELKRGLKLLPTVVGERAIRLAAHWSRTGVKEKVEEFRKALAQELKGTIVASPQFEIGFDLARVLFALQPHGDIRFVYSGVRCEHPKETGSSKQVEQLYLVGVADHLVVIAVNETKKEPIEEFELVACAPRNDCQVAALPGMVRQDLRVSFPTEAAEKLSFVVAGISFRSTESYFAPLIDLSGEQDGSLESSR